jgi:nucleoside-diphosphate-sugar epimerase
MKKILITGKNSYIGVKLIDWLKNTDGNYVINTISLRNSMWKDFDFSSYDVVFHAVGIAHIKETEENKDLYYEINRDLTLEVAKKAKNEGVKQFIYLSSMSVYGKDEGVITNNTHLNPKGYYGKSKHQAEILLSSLESDTFRIVILRPPMVYGRECKGNYNKLANLTAITPVFPYIVNERSMIYIDNLTEYIKFLIDNLKNGTFHPQNDEYVCTSEMVKLIAEVNGKKLKMTKLFNGLINFIPFNIKKKIFGNLVYDKKIDDYRCNHNVCDFQDSIKKTENFI